jgi:hypothetical protein
MKSYPLLRLKHAVVTDWTRIAALGFVVLLVSLLIAFTGFLTPAVSASPLAEEASTGTTVHSVGLQQNVRTTVVENTTAYDEGDRLRNNGMYPLNNTTTPVVLATAEGQQATITNLSLVLTYTVTPPDDRDEPFYTRTAVLESVQPDADTARVRTEFPVREVFATKNRLRDEFGRGVEVTATIHTEATYAYSSADDVTRTGSLRVGGTVSRTEKLYRLPHATERDTHTIGQPSTAASGLPSLVNGIALLVGVLVVLGLIVTYASASRSDPERVEAELQRQRFNEWVTEVDSYTPRGNRHVVNVNSLGDLVDLAIDTQRRVLSPADMDEYLVVSDNTVFRYAPSTGSQSALQFGFSDVEGPLPEVPEAPGTDDEAAFGMGDDAAPFGTNDDGTPFETRDGDETEFEWDQETADGEEQAGTDTGTGRGTEQEDPFNKPPDED